MPTTAPDASTLANWRVGGQLDESIVVPAGYQFADLSVVATLVGADGQQVIDPTNKATVFDGPYTTIVGGTPGTDTTNPTADGETTLAGRYWWTDKLKATTAADPDDALQPSGLSWNLSLQAVLRRGKTIELRSWSVTIDADRDYAAESETVVIDTSSTDGGIVADPKVINVVNLLPPPTTVPASDAFAARVAESLIVVPDGTIPIDKLEVDIATQAELNAHVHTLSLYTLTGNTAPLPPGETVVANYSNITAFEAGVAPTRSGQRAQIAGYPTAAAFNILEARWNGSTFEWGLT